MLPFLPRNAAQHIEGSRRKIEAPGFALLPFPMLEAQSAVASEGDARYDTEGWGIAMPADSRSWCVFRYQGFR